MIRDDAAIDGVFSGDRIDGCERKAIKRGSFRRNGPFRSCFQFERNVRCIGAGSIMKTIPHSGSP